MQTRQSIHFTMLLSLAYASTLCTVSREFSPSAQQVEKDLPCRVFQSLPLDQRELSLSAHLQEASARQKTQGSARRGEQSNGHVAYHLTNASLAATHPLSYLCEVAIYAQQTPPGYHLRNAGVRLTRQPLEQAIHAHLMLALVHQTAPNGLEHAQAPATERLLPQTHATQRLRGVLGVEVIALTQSSFFDSFPSAPNVRDSLSIYKSYAHHIGVLARLTGWNGFSVYQWTKKNHSDTARNEDPNPPSDDQIELAIVADALLAELADGPDSNPPALYNEVAHRSPTYTSSVFSLVTPHRAVQTSRSQICETTGCPAQIQALFRAYWPELRRHPASLQSDAGDYLVNSFSARGYTPRGDPAGNLEDLLKSALQHLDKTHQLKPKITGLRSALQVLEESP